jgi:hypothetical protein
MAEMKKLKMSEWVTQWDRDQWESAEWRQYLASTLADYENQMERVVEAEKVCDRQKEEIQRLEEQCKLLQKQLALLQKTLDVAERFSRPIVLSDSTKSEKGGGFFGRG